MGCAMRFHVEQKGEKFKVFDRLKNDYLSREFNYFDDAFNFSIGYGDIKKHFYDELKWLLRRHAIGDDVKYELKYQVYKLGGLGGVW